MASIQTGIQMADYFSAPLMNIVSSVNLAISHMEEMNSVMNAGISTASIEGARNEIIQAASAAEELKQALGEVKEPAVQPASQSFQWQGDNMQVFNTAGIVRYQQEIQSAGILAGQLANTQNEIARQAANTSIFSPDAVQDISRLAGRINGLRSQIQQMEQKPVNIGAENASRDIERLRSQINQAVQQQGELNQAMKRMDVAAANAAYLRLSNAVSNTERHIRDNITAQERFNQEVDRCRSPVKQVESGFKGWQKAIIVANNVIGLVKNTLGRTGVTDMSGAFDRLDTMNRFQKTMTTMTGDSNVAKAALEQLKDTTVGTAYGLDVAAKATQGFTTRGMGIGTAADQVRIWSDAVSFYGKGTNEQLESVVDAVGKMYTKGKVEADQLDRLFDAGIDAAGIYAKAVNTSVGKVKDDLSDGKIASAQFIETVSKALDKGVSAGAAKEAGNTWATTFANVQAAAERGWANIIQKADEALASHGLPSSMELVASFGEKVESVLTTVAENMDTIVGVAIGAGEALGSAGTLISENWGTIAPILTGIAVAWGIYKVAALTSSVAQWAMNAAMYACPVTWIAVGIGALVALVLLLANHFSGAGHTAQTAFGVICGAINVTNQFFVNLAWKIGDTSLGIQLALIAVAWNIGTAFRNVGLDILIFFDEAAIAVLDAITSIAEAISKLPFVGGEAMSDVIDGLRNTAAEWAETKAELSASKGTYVDPAAAFRKGASTHDAFKDGWLKDAYKNGARFGDAVTKGVKNYFDSKNNGPNEPEKYPALETELIKGSLPDNTKKIADNTKKTADAVAITSEDLKYLRDLAEHDYINRFTTAKITVNQTNHNNINNDMDLDGVTEHLRATMEEQMLASAEGVH